MTTVLLLDPRAIQPDLENVRSGADDDLEGLTDSIREHGVLQPLGVTDEGGYFRLVFGSRRRAAAIAAGLAEVPCLLLEVSGEDRLVRQIVENLQRRDLGDMDKANGFARLREVKKERRPLVGSERELDDLVSRSLGLSTTTVRRYLGLRELAPEVRELIAEGSLNVTQAQHLGAINNPDRQSELAKLAAERGLSAAALSRATRVAVNQPGLSLVEAVEMAERGESAPPAFRPKPEASSRLPRAPRVATEGDDDEAGGGLWDRETDYADDDEFRAPAGPTTADGNRVFRVRSVSAFADAVDRLARSIQDGDLEKAAQEEPDAPIQLRLIARQLDFIQKSLAQIARRNGWA
ncbi:MAG: ParB/RepB/Spo0J family partition protein [Chloroflexota bacterium]